MIMLFEAFIIIVRSLRNSCDTCDNRAIPANKHSCLGVAVGLTNGAPTLKSVINVRDKSYVNRLEIVPFEVMSIPTTWDLYTFQCRELICPISNYLGNYIRTFPFDGKFSSVRFLCILEYMS